MRQVYVISDSGVFTNAVERFCLRRGIRAKIFPLPTEHIFLDDSRIAQNFHYLAASIELELNAGSTQGLSHVLALVDLPDERTLEIDDMNPLARHAEAWGTVVSMLVLAFPEIHWKFVNSRRNFPGVLFDEAHVWRASDGFSEFLSLLEKGFVPLFDPTGLRNRIRARIARTLEVTGPVARYVPLRQHLAAAIDEEEVYAYFNAYTAYRFGFRSHVVTRYQMMEKLFRVPLVVNPPCVILTPRESCPFAATINHAEHPVTWSLDPTCGRIGPTGLYEAPAAIQTDLDVTIIASSVYYPTMTARAKVRLVSSRAFSIEPNCVELRSSERQQFRVEFSNAVQYRVDWQLHPQVGLLSADGCYTAPSHAHFNQIVMVTVRSINGPCQSAMAVVKLVADNSSEAEEVSVLFEDIYLNFPDVPDRTPWLPLSALCERDRHFTALNNARQRIFITVGHKRTADPARWTENECHLELLSARGVWSRVLYKPFSGLFDVWKKSGLHERLSHGTADGFRWPPETSDEVPMPGEHSAPGRLLAVADRMIQRAELILKSARSVPEAVFGALLALEAQEYLGNRTPTTSLQALALKHRLEVMAECMFYGVEYDMDVDSRLEEVARDVHSIGEWLPPRTRRLATLNSEASIVSTLVLTFREFNQFDEEQQCQSRLRHLNRRVWFHRHRSWAWLFYPVRWYFDFLLGSVPVFAAAILLWVVVLSFLYARFCDQGSSHAVVDALSSFIGMQPSHESSREVVFGFFSIAWLNGLAIGLGFVHLGIFVSHLYSIIARR